MDAIKEIEVRRVEHSEDLASPGDYVFIAKREPKVTVEKHPLLPPEGRLKRIWWAFFGAKYELKTNIEPFWPDRGVIVVNCPVCNSPCATTRHTIECVEPLTLDIPILCPYCRTTSFEIKDGKLITA